MVGKSDILYIGPQQSGLTYTLSVNMSIIISNNYELL